MIQIMKNENISNKASLPTRHGDFTIQSFKEGGKEHLAIYKEPLATVPMVRVHSECLTGDVLGSVKCDCGEQLDLALEMIARDGGIVIYHRQEGRNIGLFNKVNAYALQDKGLDTVEANHQLGFATDARTYDVVEQILDYMGVEKIKLLTNNPSKVIGLKDVEVVERVPLKIEPNEHNKEYLDAKRDQMGHIL